MRSARLLSLVSLCLLAACGFRTGLDIGTETPRGDEAGARSDAGGGGRDGGASIDLGVDQGVLSCTNHAQCDDGLTCNGLEWCTPDGLCQAGTVEQPDCAPPPDPCYAVSYLCDAEHPNGECVLISRCDDAGVRIDMGTRRDGSTPACDENTICYVDADPCRVGICFGGMCTEGVIPPPPGCVRDAGLDASRDAAVRDAMVLRDATVGRDATVRDASLRDATVRDASLRDFSIDGTLCDVDGIDAPCPGSTECMIAAWICDADGRATCQDIAFMPEGASCSGGTCDGDGNCVGDAPFESGPMICTDGSDNDGDGAIDCADDDCNPFGDECCDGTDDNDDGFTDIFTCRCASNSDCVGIGSLEQVCWSTTFSVCGPRCNRLGGNRFCRQTLGRGWTCNNDTGECVDD